MRRSLCGSGSSDSCVTRPEPPSLVADRTAKTLARERRTHPATPASPWQTPPERPVLSVQGSC